jgi:hypothetical protein
VFGEKYILSSPVVCSVLQPPVTSSFIDPNISNTLFLDNLKIYSAFSVLLPGMNQIGWMDGWMVIKHCNTDNKNKRILENKTSMLLDVINYKM